MCLCSDFIEEVSLASGNYTLCIMLFSKNIKRDARYHLFFVQGEPKECVLALQAVSLYCSGC